MPVPVHFFCFVILFSDVKRVAASLRKSRAASLQAKETTDQEHPQVSRLDAKNFCGGEVLSKTSKACPTWGPCSATLRNDFTQSLQGGDDIVSNRAPRLIERC